MKRKRGVDLGSWIDWRGEWKEGSTEWVQAGYWVWGCVCVKRRGGRGGVGGVCVWGGLLFVDPCDGWLVCMCKAEREKGFFFLLHASPALFPLSSCKQSGAGLSEGRRVHATALQLYKDKTGEEFARREQDKESTAANWSGCRQNWKKKEDLPWKHCKFDWTPQFEKDSRGYRGVKAELKGIDRSSSRGEHAG